MNIYSQRSGCVLTGKQKKIIESARRIISSKGVEKLTTHEITLDLGPTDGALDPYKRGICA